MTNDESTNGINNDGNEIEDEDCYTLMDEDGNELAASTTQTTRSPVCRCESATSSRFSGPGS